MAKRKRKQQQGRISDTKKQKLSSSFLALPAELRDHIYSFCAIMDSARITPKTKCELIGASPLLSVNKQVRQEYKGALYREAPITARVVDFNFAHVVKFLNRLSDSELKARTPTTFRGSNMDRDGCQPRAPTPSSVRKSKGKMTLRTPSEPTFEVLLLLTRGCQPNPEGLQRWLLRLENPLKKGSQISMSYRVAPRAHHLKLEACRTVRAVGAHSSLCNTLDEIIRVLTEKIRRVEELEQGKLWRDMKKVQRALWRGRPQMLKSERV